MKRFWPLLLLVVIPYQSTLAQEVKRAPTVERCRADQRLWLSKLETKSGYVSAPFTELNVKFSEMLACEKVDPASAHRYHNTRAKILAEQALRLQGFLYKHNLYDKFIAEDAQGRQLELHAIRARLFRIHVLSFSLGFDHGRASLRPTLPGGVRQYADAVHALHGVSRLASPLDATGPSAPTANM